MARALYEAFDSGDEDAFVALLDPHVEWELVGPSEIPYFGAYRGLEGVRRFLGLLAEHLEVEELEVFSVIETERGALAEGREAGHFPGRSRTFEMRWCHLLEIEGGRITRFTDHLDTAPVIEAWRSSQG